MTRSVRDIRYADKTLAGRQTWRTGENQRLLLSAPLAIDGVTVSTLFLRARALSDRPDEDVMFQLEYEHDKTRRDRAIDRIDYRPFHTHNNHGRGPKNQRHIIMSESHHHQFDLNWLAAETRLLKENLPIAAPITEQIQGFDSLLVFVGKTFRINNIDLVEAPQWQPGWF